MDRPSLPPLHSSLKSLREEVRFLDKCGNKDEPLRVKHSSGHRHHPTHHILHRELPRMARKRPGRRCREVEGLARALLA